MDKNIESHLIEKRVFKPPLEFAKNARIKSLTQYRKMYRESIRSPDRFWAREARELIWHKPWKRVLDWKAPFAKWFVGGQLNLSRSEERRVGKECRCRWSGCDYKRERDSLSCGEHVT